MKWRKAFWKRSVLELLDQMLCPCASNQSGNQRKLLIPETWVSCHTLKLLQREWQAKALQRNTVQVPSHAITHLANINAWTLKKESCEIESNGTYRTWRLRLPIQLTAPTIWGHKSHSALPTSYQIIAKTQIFGDRYENVKMKQPSTLCQNVTKIFSSCQVAWQSSYSHTLEQKLPFSFNL